MEEKSMNEARRLLPALVLLLSSGVLAMSRMPPVHAASSQTNGSPAVQQVTVIQDPSVIEEPHNVPNESDYFNYCGPGATRVLLSHWLGAKLPTFDTLG